MALGVTTYFAVLLLASLASCHPMEASSAKGNSFWKGTSMDSVVDEIYSNCLQNDTIACMKYKVLTFLDQVLRKDSFKISENIAVVKNTYRAEESESRGLKSPFLDKVQKYIQSHDILARIPTGYLQGSTMKFSPRNLDRDEVTLSLKFPSEEGKALTEARKSKLKKILVPILVFILLKAMTLIPLAIGVLGIKAWNALQLSFFSFVISVALAIFQLCKKIAADASHAQAIHGPWDSYAQHYARSFNNWAQELAYRNYAQEAENESS